MSEGVPAPSSEEKVAELQSKIESFENLLKEIKNDRGEQKYLDVDTAIKALKDSQEYIQKLKSESEESNNKLLREIESYQNQLSEREALEELMNRLGRSEPNIPVEKKEENMDEDKDKLSLEQVNALVEKKLQELKEKESAKSNLESSIGIIKANSADEVDIEKYLNDKAAETGLSKEALLNIASTSPEAFKRIVGVPAKPAPKSSGYFGGRVPPNDPSTLPDATPSTSMLYGATDAERQEYIKTLTERAMKKLGVA